MLLSAVLAEGRTVIHNAATEPEVVELALFLQRMGAQIALRPDRRFVIEGVESLSGATATLQGDRLEAFSYLVAGLMTGGEVRVGGCNQDRMVTAINTLQQMGATLEINDEWISASATSLQPSAVQTDTHPGFMTDWQPPLIVLMTQADGMSVLHETVYEDRLGYVDAVKAMGGEIELFTTCLGGPACRFHDSSAVHSAVVRGVSKLQGAEVTIPDVRAGFSSVIAAAAAEGPSTLHGIHHLERGYNAPFDTLVSLGPPPPPRAEPPATAHEAGERPDDGDERRRPRRRGCAPPGPARGRPPGGPRAGGPGPARCPPPWRRRAPAPGRRGCPGRRARRQARTGAAGRHDLTERERAGPEIRARLRAETTQGGRRMGRLA